MTMDLPYNTALKLTTAKYYIPSGRCIQAINYKHGNGGTKELVPDSLTKLFHTANGRPVRDGGGIMPDVEVKADSLPNIAFYLAGVRDSNAQPEDFDLTDADYAEFKQRVLNSKFTYDRESEKFLKELVKLAKFEGYYDDAKTEFEALEKKLSHNIAKDLDIHKEAVKRLIIDGIIPSYYFQKGRIRHSLVNDKQMKEALKLLADTKRYTDLLKPQPKATQSKAKK